MKSRTPELLKFKRLQRLLRDTRRGTIGLLEGMWLEVAKNCPAGDIGRFSNEEIAILCDWDGDPDELIQALVDTRWLDTCDTHRLVVHDWEEHSPNYVKGNIKKHGREFARGASPEHPPHRAEEPPQAMLPSSLPDDTPTKPNLTKPNPTQPMEQSSWDGVEKLLVELGIGRRPKVMSHLRGCGSEPFKIEQIVGVWQSRQRSFTNPTGALFERLMNEHPGLAADTGWVVPLKTDTGQRKPRDRTLDFEMQRTHLVKQLRSEGKDEEHIEAAVQKLAARLKEKAHAT